MLCDGLRRFARNGAVSSFTASRDVCSAQSRFPYSHGGPIFFMFFVDGIFTTFIASLFTNTSDAIGQSCVISCV